LSIVIQSWTKVVLKGHKFIFNVLLHATSI
jgi:hypothetical protein